jgi:hypothetical protein
VVVAKESVNRANQSPNDIRQSVPVRRQRYLRINITNIMGKKSKNPKKITEIPDSLLVFYSLYKLFDPLVNKNPV